MQGWRQTAMRLAAGLVAAAVAGAGGFPQRQAEAAGAAVPPQAPPAIVSAANMAPVTLSYNRVSDPEAIDAGRTEEAFGTPALRDIVVLTVRASRTAAYESREELASRGLRQALEDAAQRREDAPQAHMRAERLDTFVAWPGTNKTYAVDEDGSVVDVAAGVRLRTPARWRRELSAAQQRLRARYYGALLPWSEVNTAVPRMAKFDVIDIETGLSFQAQRRAGSAHADVQPLTKADSATMKRIYGGSWSWDRRAVLLRHDGQLLAASMNGKPHGGDGIPDNGFNGHFCIHFLGSTTHGKANVDLAHQAMLHKAAGRLSPFLNGLTPYQAADLFVIAYNQQDRQLLDALAVDGDAQATIPDSFRQMRVKLLRRNEPLPEADSTQPLEINEPSIAWSMDVTVYVEGSSKGRRTALTFDLVRSPSEGWLVRNVSL